MQTGVDTPTHRATINELPEDIAQAHLDGIRERRMRTFQVYQEVQAEKAKARAASVSKQLEKQLAMLAKEIASLDKYCEKVEVRLNKVRALRLELEQE